MRIGRDQELCDLVDVGDDGSVIGKLIQLFVTADQVSGRCYEEEVLK